MKFDKSRVYTVINAEELKAGDKVIVADTIEILKERVEKEHKICELLGVASEKNPYRFAIDDVLYALAYLVERAENCTNCEYQSRSECLKEKKDNILYCCEFYKSRTLKGCDNCIHADIKDSGTMLCRMGFLDCTPPHNFICSDYEPKTEPKAEPHYRPFKDTDELIKVWCNKCPAHNHRDRGLTMPLIWVKNKGDGSKVLITGFNQDDNEIMIYDCINLTDLFEHFTFLDGSPCGVEE